MIAKILNYLFFILRQESVDIGNFTNLDILRIFKLRFINLIRGLLFLFFHFKKIRPLFLGSRSKIIGAEKIKFGNTITIGNSVKISSIGSSGYVFGKNFSIRDYSVIDSFGSIKKESGSLTIGSNVGVSEFCYLAVRGNIQIGNDVIIGPGVKIFSENHSYELSHIPFRLQDEIRGNVIIGNNVWIGSNVIILAGVVVEDNVVIAAGSVVNKSLKGGALYGGVPVNFLRILK